MAGASRCVSPSGWLWNVCPRSPPRHRVAAAPSLTVAAAVAAAAVDGFAAEGAAGRSRGRQDPGIGGDEAVRQPPNPPPSTARHPPPHPPGVEGATRKRAQAREGETRYNGDGRYLLRGISGVRSISASPVCEAATACLPACQPPRSESKGFSNMPACVSPPDHSGSSTGGSSILSRAYASPGRCTSKGEIARPCLEWRRECSAFSFPGDIVIRALLPFVFFRSPPGSGRRSFAALDAL